MQYMVIKFAVLKIVFMPLLLVSKESLVKSPTSVSYMNRQMNRRINRTFIMIWWEREKLTHWSTFSIPCLENVSETLPGLAGFHVTYM